MLFLFPRAGSCSNASILTLIIRHSCAKYEFRHVGTLRLCVSERYSDTFCFRREKHAIRVIAFDQWKKKKKNEFEICTNRSPYDIRMLSVRSCLRLQTCRCAYYPCRGNGGFDDILYYNKWFFFRLVSITDTILIGSLIRR